MTHSRQSRVVSRIGVAVLPLLVGACSVNGRRQEPPPVVAPDAKEKRTAPEGTKVEQVGNASWYGPTQHGKKTASGETFDQNELTAASKTLPLGTKAVVTNLATGKSVEVTINDRGPYVKGRKIDLSRAAAQQIGMTKKGVAQVKIQTTTHRKPTGKKAARREKHTTHTEPPMLSP